MKPRRNAFFKIATVGLANLPLLGCALLARPSGPEDILNKLIEALNTKDKTAIGQFVKEHATGEIPAADRVERLADLADQGAPFTIVGKPLMGKDGLQAKFKDRNGIELDVVFIVRGDPPKMAGLRARPAAQPAKDYSDYKDLQSLTTSVAKDTHAPGLSAAVIKDGQLETKAFGVREVGGSAQVGPDEPWEIGSIGKSLCSTVIGKLVEAGELRFEMTLKEALPGYAMKPGYEAVTLEQVMHHRGGIPEDPGMRRPEVQRIVGEAKSPIDIRTNYVKDILAREPIAKPGTRFAYSNAGYALLSKVIEVATGEPYEEALKHLLFRPLRLKNSFTGVDAVPVAHPSGHVEGPGGLEPVAFKGPMNFMFAGAGGGLWMSTADLAQYGQAHLDGLLGKDGYLKAATVKRLHACTEEGQPGQRSYACGWGIVTEHDLPVKHGHNGSDGTFRAELALYPDLKLVVAAIVNRGGESEPTPGELVVWAVAKKSQKG